MTHASEELEDVEVGLCVTVIQGRVNVPENTKLLFPSLFGNVVQNTTEVEGQELDDASATFWVVVGIS